MAGTATKQPGYARLLPNGPAFVEVPPAALELSHWIKNLPAPDVNVVADPKLLWKVATTAAEGTAAGSATSAGTAYVVSAEAFRRLRAHRF
jgi:hypothetical protein